MGRVLCPGVGSRLSPTNTRVVIHPSPARRRYKEGMSKGSNAYLYHVSTLTISQYLNLCEILLFNASAMQRRSICNSSVNGQSDRVAVHRSECCTKSACLTYAPTMQATFFGRLIHMIKQKNISFILCTARATATLLLSKTLILALKPVYVVNLGTQDIYTRDTSTTPCSMFLGGKIFCFRS